MTDGPRQRRFAVALSFPGETRAYVSQVAEHLRSQVPVFYDAYYEAELARFDLDLHLQDIYHDDAELIVAFLCHRYEQREWCGIEWRAIRDLIKRRDQERVMLMRFDDATVPGVFSLDGYIDLRRHSPLEAADLICERLRLLRSRSPRPHTDPSAPPICAPSLPRVAGTSSLQVGSPLPNQAAPAPLPASTVPPEGDVLALEAWPRFLAMDSIYPALRDDVLLTIINNDYELALTQYWRLLYYTGTRELWTDRAFLTQRLLDLSKRHRDYATAGLIVAKGQAWPLIYQGKQRSATKVLEQAHELLARTKSPAALAVYWEYAADIASQNHNLPLADDLYTTARRLLRDRQAQKVELKRLFANAQHDDLACRGRVTALERLREEFGCIKSYMEGFVQMELAKTLYFLRAPEAVRTAEAAYTFLNNDVMMPTTAAKARALLRQMLRARKGVTP